MGDNVYARNYREGPRWLPGRVVQMEGAVLAQVQLPDGHTLRRHVDQLRPRSAGPEDLGVTESENPEGEDGLEAIVPNSSQTALNSPRASKTQKPQGGTRGRRCRKNSQANQLIHPIKTERLMTRRTLHHKVNKELSVDHPEHDILQRGMMS